MPIKEKNASAKTIAMAALFAALTYIATFFFQFPVPGAQDYIHIGDGFVILAAGFLSGPWGLLAGAVGACLADLLSPYAVWTPWTFCIKLLCALAARPFLRSEKAATRLLGCALFALVNTAGYFLAGSVLYGSMATALLAVPFTLLQSALAGIIYFLLAPLMKKLMEVR